MQQSSLKTDATILAEIIDCFCGIANSNNMGTAKSDSDIAMTIGKLANANHDAAEDLKVLLCKEKCTLGMVEYLKTFDNGALVSLSEEIGDGEQYINVLRKKFDADARIGYGMLILPSRKSEKLFWNIRLLQKAIK